jgi:hypothetical protein
MERFAAGTDGVLTQLRSCLSTALTDSVGVTRATVSDNGYMRLHVTVHLSGVRRTLSAVSGINTAPGHAAGAR